MKQIKLDLVQKFVEKNIDKFHKNRLKCLQETDLKKLLRKKNPYLFRAKNLLTAEQLVNALLEAHLSSSEEKIFGDFLEELAIFVASYTLDAHKSSSTGIDFEYSKNSTRYLVSVKSGLNWGNSSQWRELEANFKNAMKILKQSSHTKNVECVLGVSYGKAATTIKKGFIRQICGQAFWHLITGDETFYLKIIKPLGHKAKDRNEFFNIKKAALINVFTKEFIEGFCDKNGSILWEKVVEINSKNLTDADKNYMKGICLADL